MFATPTETIERECTIKKVTQKSVALSYALAISDQAAVPVDWKRVNAAIVKRWPKGLMRIKKMAWKAIETGVSPLEGGR